MENVEVVVSPPDVCYLYPPYDHTSSSMFTVRARSKSNPVAYKILCFKNKRMRVCVEERIQYRHFPADRGVIKPGTTKVFKVYVPDVWMILGTSLSSTDPTDITEQRSFSWKK